MSTGLPSDEVAEDYKNSLEDLTMNSRYEISNLTVIAKENLDHAMAIARVLEHHINSTPPTKKLPALYVLDSIVKNVGAPYTLFLGQNLFRTFMDAYTLVDGPIRRKLEEMLKTWKEPVPGSIDTRPVFSPEVTRRIDNALIKARTAAVQLQQQQARSQQHLLQRRPGTNTPPVPGPGWRNTPTPPRPAQYYGQPDQQVYQQPRPGMDGFQNQYQPPPPPFPEGQPYPPPQMPQNTRYGQSAPGIDSLNRDIDRLIDRAKAELSANPYNAESQQRLKALLDLKEIVQSQQLPYDQLMSIQAQVAMLSQGPPTPSQAPPHVPPQYSNDRPQYGSIPPTSSAPPPNSVQVPQFAPGALAALLQATARNTSTPPQPTLTPTQVPTLPKPNDAAPPSALLASLRAAGILPQSTPTPTPNLPFPNAQSAPPSNILPFASGPNNLLASLPTRNVQGISQINQRKKIEMKSSTLREPNLDLIEFLYEARPNQCMTCGIRFLQTEEDKKKKARHLDWHFRINQRMVEAAKRGQSRSWYLDEREWIKNRETDEQEEGNGSASGGQSNGGLLGVDTKKNPKKRWIPVPNDPALASLHCPICQEKFETVWLDEAQEWVWMDAVHSGGRVYHASCHDEATKDREATPRRTVTPEPLLGKRKAVDADLTDPVGKVRREVGV